MSEQTDVQLVKRLRAWDCGITTEAADAIERFKLERDQAVVSFTEAADTVQRLTARAEAAEQERDHLQEMLNEEIGAHNRANAKLAAAERREAEKVEAGFRAGYHCQWIKAEQRYIFDPLMKPGDPDGAYHAWCVQLALASPSTPSPAPSEQALCACGHSPFMHGAAGVGCPARGCRCTLNPTQAAESRPAPSPTQEPQP